MPEIARIEFNKVTYARKGIWVRSTDVLRDTRNAW